MSVPHEGATIEWAEKLDQMKSVIPQAELVSDTEYREQVHNELMGIQRRFQDELDDLVNRYTTLIDP